MSGPQGKALSGEVTITLGGRERTLVPTLEAAMRVDAHFGGYASALEKLRDFNLAAFVYVIRQGLGERKVNELRLQRQVYEAGTLRLLAPISHFVMVLANGGMSPEPDEGDEDREGDEGNDSA